MGKKLTKEQIDAYHRDGFLSPVEIFTEAEAAALRAEFESAEARWPEAFSGAGRNNAHLVVTCLDRIVHDARILDAVEDLIGPDILTYGSVLFIKEPEEPGFVSWHQDVRYMGLEPHAGVTAWVALSPSTTESGCMKMIPGSHLPGLRPHEDTFGEDNILTRGQRVEGVDESLAVDLPLRPGQASFHHLRTIHGSLPNLSQDRRMGFAIQAYLSPEVVPTQVKTPAQLARGRDPFGHFDPAPRPAADMAPADVAFRAGVNDLWAENLYQGADRRRNY